MTQPYPSFLTTCAVAILLAASLLGCRTTTPYDPPVIEVTSDSRLRRLADDGQETFAEGDVEAAIDHYRKAVRRAWALDDPLQTGTLAYNLAACLLSDGNGEEAIDWLIESRAELRRAERSVGYTYLLQAKIARSQGRLNDAQELIALAECTCPPCEEFDSDDSCGSDDPCDPSCATSLPCVGAKIDQKTQAENCQIGYQAQVQLAKARIANDYGDIDLAQRHLQCARNLVADSCQRSLASEIQNVAAEIHLTREEPLQAARHFDSEADRLRIAGIVREIPYSLEMAAQSYADAGRLDLAADRWARAARIFHGRGDEKRAWQCVLSATQFATGVLMDASCVDQNWSDGIIESDLIHFADTSMCQGDAIERRLAVVAREIQRALEKDSPAPSDQTPPEPNQ